jgi:hypothetical protein
MAGELEWLEVGRAADSAGRDRDRPDRAGAGWHGRPDLQPARLAAASAPQPDRQPAVAMTGRDHRAEITFCPSVAARAAGRELVAVFEQTGAGAEADHSSP